MRGVRGGNRLAQTDYGERLILEGGEFRQSLGAVNCHIYVECGSMKLWEKVCLLHEFPRSASTNTLCTIRLSLDNLKLHWFGIRLINLALSDCRDKVLKKYKQFLHFC